MAGIKPYYSTFRSPVGDILGLFGHCQMNSRCRDIELNVLDCTDVYGRKGLTRECRDLYEDYYECIYLEKTKARVEAMRKERTRQYLAGEREKKNLYAETPQLDGFWSTYGKSID